LLIGYETTANSITYGLIALALEEKVQDNIIKELDDVWEEASAAGRSELSYSRDFEKLTYLYGFMYETFRLFPGVVLITKVAEEPQTIITSHHETGDKSSHRLPASTRVYLNTPSVHYHPTYWPDPYKLDPARWEKAVSVGAAKTSGKKIAAADKTRQMRGTLLTFSDGSRACLGRKFAQAEYMAFFAQLLRDYRVEVAPGVDPVAVKRDLYLKCEGKMTLTPMKNIKLALRSRRGDGGD
jgi:cytochrome P450